MYDRPSSFDTKKSVILFTQGCLVLDGVRWMILLSYTKLYIKWKPEFKNFKSTNVNFCYRIYLLTSRANKSGR